MGHVVLVNTLLVGAVVHDRDAVRPRADMLKCIVRYFVLVIVQRGLELGAWAVPGTLFAQVGLI